MHVICYKLLEGCGKDCSVFPLEIEEDRQRQLVSPSQPAMEKFSEEQNANAIKFMQEYLSRWADGARFTPLRLRFTKEELEGECLHMARTYLSEK